MYNRPGKAALKKKVMVVCHIVCRQNGKNGLDGIRQWEVCTNTS